MIYSSQLVSEFEIHITEARESTCNCKQLQQKSVSSAAMFGHQQGRSPNVGVDSGILTAERLEVAPHEVLIVRSRTDGWSRRLWPVTRECIPRKRSAISSHSMLRNGFLCDGASLSGSALGKRPFVFVSSVKRLSTRPHSVPCAPF